MQTKFNGGVGWKANEACKIAYPLETKMNQTETILRYNKLHIKERNLTATIQDGTGRRRAQQGDSIIYKF